MAGGADCQFGFVSETTPGTALTVTKFLPIVSEKIQRNPNYIDTKTLSARRVLRITRPGAAEIGGPVRLELANTTLATLLRHMFGTIATTGAGPFTHTASPGDLTGKAMTMQVGRPDSTGVVRAFTYAGCKIKNWKIAAQIGEIANLDLDIVGMTETTATALATAAYDATWSPFTFVEGSVTVAGSPVTTVRSVELSSDNKIQKTRVRMGSANSKEPLENGVRAILGTIATDFDALTNYNLCVNATQTALVLTFSNGTQSLTITMNVLFVGETPTVDSADLLDQPLPYRVISGTSDAAGITAVLINSESSSA
ncbi:MAG TPA: phage tail tube protein [Acidimicrobiales bacterium]|nr:phage tail tube protein [Acidimicrobiales bacterium]